MNFYYLASGDNAFCIVNENNNLILNHENAYKELNIKFEGRKKWSYHQIYRDTKSLLKTFTIEKAFNEWKEKNINNIPYSPEQLKKIQEIDVPF